MLEYAYYGIGLIVIYPRPFSICSGYFKLFNRCQRDPESIRLVCLHDWI